MVQWVGRALLRLQGFRPRLLSVGETGRRMVLYERAGSGWGPPVLLVHGLGGAATSFLPLASRLLPISRRVLLVDLPGHGMAGALPGERWAGLQELEEGLLLALREVGEPALLLGNSLGGGLCFSAALREPERVAGVLGLSPAGAPLYGEERAELLHAFRGGNDGAWELGSRLFHRRPLTFWLVARSFGAHVAGAQVQELLRSLPEGEVLPAEGLDRIDRPALVLWGNSDRVLPASCLAFFQEHLPPGSVEMVADCGHLPQMEKARLVAEQVHAFMARIARGGARAPDAG
jgi:pimeloyl-ACP methyl ester carboxylesterase